MINLNIPAVIRRRFYPKPNLLKNTQCYLIGHMQYANGEGWRDSFTEFAEKLNIKIYNPYDKPFVHNVPEDEVTRQMLKHWMETEQYDLVASWMKRVRGDDLRCIDKCDFFVAFIKPTIASWGSSEEISMVIYEKKPLFLVIDDPQGKRACPLWLMGIMPHKYIYNTIDEVKEMLTAIDSGVVKMSSDRWKLFKPERR